MYVKRHAVRRGSKRYVYLRLVQAYRDEHGRVRHRVLKTLGREDELKASGQLEQLMGSQINTAGVHEPRARARVNRGGTSASAATSATPSSLASPIVLPTRPTLVPIPLRRPTTSTRCARTTATCTFHGVGCRRRSTTGLPPVEFKARADGYGGSALQLLSAPSGAPESVVGTDDCSVT